MKVVNDTEDTAQGPGASNVVFTSSEPKLTEGAVTVWGEADWELSTSSDFSTDLQVRSTPLTSVGVQTGPNFNLADGTDYYVRTKYTSDIPSEVSQVSKINHFKTAGAGVPDIKDIFSTTLYTGNNATQEIKTGIDNSSKSLVWIKLRNDDNSHSLQDTLRGTDWYLASNTANPQIDLYTRIRSFDSDGFTTGDSPGTNASGYEYVAWNFKAAPGFFDVVTYEGNGAAGQTIPHSLGSAPGMIIWKNCDRTTDWVVYHKDLGTNTQLRLNEDIASFALSGFIASESNEIEVGNNADINGELNNMLAYLFADNPAAGIKCGSYTGTNTDQDIDVGFEPGWIMIKSTTGSTDWAVFDSKRDGNPSNNRKALYPSRDLEENGQGSWGIKFNGNNVTLPGGTMDINSSGNTYIYVAIADPTTTAYYDEVNSRQVSQHELVRRFGVDADTTNLRNQGIYPLVNQPTGMTDAFVKEGDVYRAVPNRSMDVFHAQQEANEANERLDEANASIEALRSSLEIRIAALEADHMTLMDDNNNNNGGY
jgi:hypothetical protein